MPPLQCPRDRAELILRAVDAGFFVPDEITSLAGTLCRANWLFVGGFTGGGYGGLAHLPLQPAIAEIGPGTNGDEQDELRHDTVLRMDDLGRGTGASGRPVCFACPP